MAKVRKVRLSMSMDAVNSQLNVAKQQVKKLQKMLKKAVLREEKRVKAMKKMFKI